MIGMRSYYVFDVVYSSSVVNVTKLFTIVIDIFTYVLINLSTTSTVTLTLDLTRSKYYYLFFLNLQFCE